MKTKTFGLDIGSTFIKAISLKKENGKLTLESIGVSPATAHGILSESEIDHKLLAETILRLLHDAQIPTKDANVAIPESQVYAKILEMPELSEQELDAALKWEIEQYIPLPLDQVRTDRQILEKKEIKGKKVMSVLLVAAAISLLDKYEKVLTLAGLNPVTIETEMVSVQRALSPLLTTQHANLILHMGSSTTDIAIIKNNIVQMVSYTNVGGASITRAVSVDLGIDIHQAEDLKRAYGLNQEVFEGKVGKALRPIIDSIVMEIKRSILVFQEKNENEQISQIILSGGSALLPGLDVFLTNTFGIQVVIGNCWKLFSIGNVPNEILSFSPTYNVVVGLALKDLL